MDTSSLDRKKIIIIGMALFGVLLFLLLLLAIFSASRSSTPESQTSNSQGPQGFPNSQKLVPSPPPFPKVSVKNWTLHVASSSAVPSAQIYTFKPIVAKEEAAALSQKIMGTNTVEEKTNGLFIASQTDKSGDNLSIFLYNPAQGEFSYASTRGIVLPGQPTASIQSRVDTMVQILFADRSLKVTATYKKKDKPGVTYYEIHRDWGVVGHPILSALGLLNLSGTQSFSSLSLTGRQGSPVSDTIYQTSDASDGLARSDDFNTMTIGVKDADLTVASLKSNIRQLQTTSLKITPLISYEEAVTKLKNAQYEAFYTAPIGTGTPSFDKVYPDNQGLAENALVEDSIVAYLEEPPQVSQAQLKPYYFFRGTAKLTSGYEVRFIATVAATGGGNVKGLATSAQPQNYGGQQQATFNITLAPRPGSCGTGLTCPPTPSVIAPTRIPQVTAAPPPHCGTTKTCPPTATPLPPTPTPTPLFITPVIPSPTATPTPTVIPIPIPTATPAPCGTGPGQQQCTFEVTPVPTKIPTISIPTITPTPTLPPVMCIPSITDLNNKRSVSSSLVVGQLTQAGFDSIKKADVHHGEIIAVGDWYTYSSGSALTAEDIVSAYQALPKPKECSDPFAFNKPSVCNDRINRATSEVKDEPLCPIRISGNSPTIFIYGKIGQALSIQPRSSVTYSDPGVVNKKWQVKIQAGGMLHVGGVSKDYLYYEHAPVSFDRPQKGWTISKNNLESFVASLSQKLRLNSQEQNRLLFELQYAAASVRSRELFVGIIPQKEVISKLPLSVSPGVSTQRLHFFIGSKAGDVTSPYVRPIQRSNSMILEIGASGE